MQVGIRRLHEGITHETHQSLKHRIRSGWLAALATAAVVALASPLRTRRPPPPALARCVVECRSGEGAPDRRAQRVERGHAAASRRAADRRNAHPGAAADQQLQRADWPSPTGAPPMRRWSHSLDATRQRDAGPPRRPRRAPWGRAARPGTSTPRSARSSSSSAHLDMFKTVASAAAPARLRRLRQPLRHHAQPATPRRHHTADDPPAPTTTQHPRRHRRQTSGLARPRPDAPSPESRHR